VVELRKKHWGQHRGAKSAETSTPCMTWESTTAVGEIPRSRGNSSTGVDLGLSRPIRSRLYALTFYAKIGHIATVSYISGCCCRLVRLYTHEI